MHYNSWDLGQQDGGAVVRVALAGNAANFRLMDSSNYRSFPRGEQHRYFGGHYDRSPITLPVPNAGHRRLRRVRRSRTRCCSSARCLTRLAGNHRVGGTSHAVGWCRPPVGVWGRNRTGIRSVQPGVDDDDPVEAEAIRA
jgi:Domain of unknown function (DUF1883)